MIDIVTMLVITKTHIQDGPNLIRPFISPAALQRTKKGIGARIHPLSINLKKKISNWSHDGHLDLNVKEASRVLDTVASSIWRRRSRLAPASQWARPLPGKTGHSLRPVPASCRGNVLGRHDPRLPVKCVSVGGMR